jgi:hypothetical protein
VSGHSAEIDVRVAPSEDGYAASVTVREGRSETRHHVAVPRAAIDRLAPGADPALLVRESFEFLLEREPKESILGEFEISVIGRYFPEYPAEIHRRLANAERGGER